MGFDFSTVAKFTAPVALFFSSAWIVVEKTMMEGLVFLVVGAVILAIFSAIRQYQWKERHKRRHFP